MHDIRCDRIGRRAAGFGDVYHPDDYAPARRWAAQLRAAGSSALVYDSVRASSGQCVAVFMPRALAKRARPAI